MSFTYDLTASGTALAVARIRLDIGDTVSGAGVRVTGGNFSDEELLDLYTREGDSQTRASARAAEVLAFEWARMVDTTAGPIQQRYSQAADRWAKLAASLRDTAGGAVVVTSGALRRADGYAYRAGSVDATL